VTVAPASAPVWCIALGPADAPALALFEPVLEPECAALSLAESGAGWVLRGYSAMPPDRARLSRLIAACAAAAGIAPPTLDIARLEARDWVAAVARDSPPITVGRFFVAGAQNPPPPPGRVVLRIDAGMAFGSGRHETTRGCLAALEGLARYFSPSRCLDLGCGSGILAIAMARLWRAPVIAADSDPVAVAIAAANAAANGVRLGVVRSDGMAHPALRRGAGFGLITANILAPPLIRMAPSLARRLAPGGVAVLSGLLVVEEARLGAAYRAAGLVRVRRIHDGAWSTLVMKRPAG
jgi:ribosomal protein L11 methyltransferase